MCVCMERDSKHEYWLGTIHDWLGLCPTIPNLGYATALAIGTILWDSNNNKEHKKNNNENNERFLGKFGIA